MRTPRLGSNAVQSFPLLVATDLDGTIVRSDGTISARTVAAFARVEAAGARFALVTGRPPRVMREIAATFGHRGTAICSNGALEYDMRTDTVTARHLIQPAQLGAAAAALRAAVPGIGIAVERPNGRAADDAYEAVSWDANATIPRPGDEALFGEPAAKLLARHLGYGPDELLALAVPVLAGLVSVTHSNGKGLIEPEHIAAAARALRTAIPGIGIAVEYADGQAADDRYQAVNWDKNLSIPRPGDVELFARPAAKLLGRHLDYTPDELLALATPVLDGIVFVSHSNGKSLIEASAAGVSKASAIAELAAAHGILPSEVLAFGDMPNDLPMLSWAGTSCAVANAHPDVLAAATHVIGPVTDDGVAIYLESVFA